MCAPFWGKFNAYINDVYGICTFTAMYQMGILLASNPSEISVSLVRGKRASCRSYYAQRNSTRGARQYSSQSLKITMFRCERFY